MVDEHVAVQHAREARKFRYRTIFSKRMNIYHKFISIVTIVKVRLGEFLSRRAHIAVLEGAISDSSYQDWVQSHQ